MKTIGRTKAAIAVSTLSVALSLASHGRTIYVDDDAPADFSTIQAAIDDANDGDTVIIQPGLYTGPGNRDITIKSKAITVQSVDPNDPDTVAATVIDCEGTQSDPHRGFYFSGGVHARRCSLAGLTIIRGYAVNGGGIYCYEYASPMIRNCHFIANHAIMRGGAMYASWGAPVVCNCIFVANSVSNTLPGGEGGGIYCGPTGSVTISGCIVTGNSASGSGANRGKGGGIFLSNVNAAIGHCTVVGNAADAGGGISCNGSTTVTIVNSIVRSNIAPASPQISGAPLVSYANVEGGWPGLGNIDADALFVDLVSGDYHLSAGSPCIDAGDSQCVPYSGQTDWDDQPRVMGLRTDMGADEYASSPTAVLNVYPKQLAFYADVDGPNPESQVLHIENAGYAPLLWTIAEDCPWLAISESADETSGVCVDVNVIGLDPGRYDCEVAVTADHVPNSPQLVSVSLYIRAGRYLYVPWPYDTIQSAIEAAQDGDTVIIQRGTYTGPGNRDIDFLGKAITVRSTDPNDPAVVAATIIDCNGTSAEPHRAFVFHRAEDTNSVLAGLTITRGFADGGGGLYVSSSSPTILCCDIIGNACMPPGGGGGIYIRFGGPHIEGCLIADNRCDRSSRSVGAGVYSSFGAPVILRCRIRSNQVRSRGGGICCQGGTLVLSSCVVMDNKVKYAVGAGVDLQDLKGVMENCVIAKNGPGHVGVGVYVRRSELTIRNCTIAENTGESRGAGIYFSLGKLCLINTILWGNKAPKGSQIAIYSWNGIYDERTPSHYRLTGTVDVWASNIEGGQARMYIDGDPRCLELNWGEGNIDVDPLFASLPQPTPAQPTPGEPRRSGGRSLTTLSMAASADYHLKSQAGRWDPAIESWVIDEVTSPCIDAGDPNSPVGDEPEPNGGRINMGAYGGTPEASKSCAGS